MTENSARFVRTLTTRGYELDLERRIPPAVLVRYLEHLRWESIAVSPREVGELFEDGRFMVVRAQRLQVERELGQGVELTCSLWIGRVGRSSVDFHHELRLGGGGELAARAVVTGVALGADGRPAEVPDALRSAVTGGPGPFLELEPPRDPPPEGAWTRRFEVRPSDLDLLQHVNQANYVVYCDDTRRLAARAGVYGASSAAAARPVARVSIEYLRQAVLGDQLEMLTWPLPGLEGRLGFELRRAGSPEPLCRARLEAR